MLVGTIDLLECLLIPSSLINLINITIRLLVTNSTITHLFFSTLNK